MGLELRVPCGNPADLNPKFSAMTQHYTVTDAQIRALLIKARAAGHTLFVEVCIAALERDVLPSNPPAHVARQRCAEAIDTGHYIDCIDKDLPHEGQIRLREIVEKTSREVHVDCGGTVVLDHEVWRCQKCRRAPLSVLDTKTTYGSA